MRGWIIFGTLHTVLLALVASRIFQNAKNPSSFTDEGSCGLRPHETYVVVSRNVVFPGGVRPAARTIPRSASFFLENLLLTPSFTGMSVRLPCLTTLMIC